MKLYKTTVMNGFVLNEQPFRREFELEGILTVHPELLSLNDDDLIVSKVIAVEPYMRNKRGSKNHRPDMFVAIKSGQIGVVELKKGPIDTKALDQLRQYLENKDGLAENAFLKKYKEEEGNEDINLRGKSLYVGILVGNQIDETVKEELKKLRNVIRIYGVSVKRYTIESHDTFLLSEIYGKKGRDTTKYQIDGGSTVYGKARFVLEIIRRYVAKKPSITYDELKVVFPDKLRGVRNSQWGCFVKKIEAERLRKASGYSRHFLDDDIIRIGDGEIAVSSQWGIGNIKPFVEQAKKLKFEIKRVK